VPENRTLKERNTIRVGAGVGEWHGAEIIHVDKVGELDHERRAGALGRRIAARDKNWDHRQLRTGKYAKEALVF